VQTITGTGGIQITGTASDVIVGIASAGTITTQVVNASGTGSNFSSFGVYPRVGGSYVPPTQPLELAPVQYVNDSVGAYLPLSGGTMSGSINMGTQQITNAGAITTTAVNTTALSLPNASVGGISQVAITALQTDTNGIASNNMYITQTSGALSLFKPLANPVIIYTAGISANLFTYLVPQFYGERHIFTGSAVSPILNYNTNTTYTVGGNSISLNPFYVEVTNGSANTLTVKVRYPAGGIPPAAYPPVSTAPTTVAPSGTWADQAITVVGGTTSTTPPLLSGATKRLFFNGTNWFLI
jgi:hypothetical protein